MDATLLLSYQIEYENSNITIDEFCLKHSTDSHQLKGHEHWTRRNQQTTEPEEPENIVTVLEPEHIVTTLEQNLEDSTSPEEMMKDIKQFKRSLLNNCIDFMNKNSQYAEVKEIKDMAKIVMDLEDSFKDKTDTGPTINVLVQNITEGFRDDC